MKPSLYLRPRSLASSTPNNIAVVLTNPVESMELCGSEVADGELVRNDDYEALLAAIIDERYLMEITQKNDLTKEEYLQIRVDTATQSLFELSELLPSLKHLVLDESAIGSIRDLGVGLRCLLSLSLSNCGLFDLDGIGVLTGLQELNLSDNRITDVTPLAMHENLVNLNLRENRIRDLSFGDVLATCPRLHALFLTDNPVEKAPSYRSIVAYLMPSLSMLDGRRLEDADRARVSHGLLLEAAAALKVLAEDQEDEERFESDLFDEVLPAKGSKSVSVSDGAPAEVQQMVTEEVDFESPLDVLDEVLTGQFDCNAYMETMKDVVPDAVPVRITALALEEIGSTRRPAPDSDRRSKSAISGSSLRFSDKLSSSPDGRMDAFSPRQRNSSRPQSAANGSLFTSCFVPFVFSNKSKDSKDDSDEDEVPHQRTVKKAVQVKEVTRGPGLGQQGRSIVHMDIVRRNKSEKFLSVTDLENSGLEVIEEVGSSSSSSGGVGASGQQDSDAEDIAVTHHERMSLMSSTSNHSNSSVLKTRQGVLAKLRAGQKATPQKQSSSALAQDHGKQTTPSKEGIAAGHTVSSKAGSSLGFNLAGSLAAIDQWVQDMSSESEDEVLPMQRPPRPAAGVTSDKAAAQSQTQADEDAFTPRGSLRSDRILSRDAIFQMCADSTTAKRNRTRPQVSREESEEGVRLSTSVEGTPQGNRRRLADRRAEAQIRRERERERAAELEREQERETERLRELEQAAHRRAAQQLNKPAKHAHQMTDADLLELLRQPPKSDARLRSKKDFKQFFGTLAAEHFQRLVVAAYANIADDGERASKINKRLEIMQAGAV